MSRASARLSLVFSCLGHGYMHLFTAMYFVIAVSLEGAGWNELPYEELIKLWALGGLLVGLAALPAGWLGDRWSASGMMIVFFLGLGLSSIVCGLVDAPTAMFLGLSAIGLFAAIYHPVGIAWLVRNADARGKALGINGVFGSVGIAIAGISVGVLTDAFSWRAAFIVPGAVSVLTGLALLYYVATGRVTDGARRASADQPTSRQDRLRAYLILLVTMLCMGLIFQATQASLPKHFDLRLDSLIEPARQALQSAFPFLIDPAAANGGRPTVIGLMITLVYVAGGVMQIAGGYLADKWPLKPIYAGSLLLQVAVLGLVAVVAGAPLLIVAAFTVLLSTAALPAENMLLARYTPAKRHGLAYGVKFVLAFSTAPLAIWMASAVKQSTGELSLLYWLLGGFAALAGLVALLLPGDTAREPGLPRAQPAE
ncbi:MAG: MFS transporter [Rhodovibrionaceae bacterium]